MSRIDEESHDLFTSFEIRDAIGQLADGRNIDPRLLPFVHAAVSMLCPTSDRGEQQFVVGISQCGLFNVDTEELIWPRGASEDIFDDLPLRALTDRELWNTACQHWEREDPLAWIAFVWRIAVPLSNHLGFTAAWR